MGQAGIGLEHDGFGGDGLQVFEQAQLGGGPVASDEAHQVGPPGVELLDEPLGLGTEEGLPVFGGGHEGGDGEVTQLLHGQERLVDLVEVLEGLEDVQVGAGLDQWGRLFAE